MNKNKSNHSILHQHKFLNNRSSYFLYFQPHLPILDEAPRFSVYKVLLYLFSQLFVLPTVPQVAEHFHQRFPKHLLIPTILLVVEELKLVLQH